VGKIGLETLGLGLEVAKQSACIALTIAIQCQTAPASNVGRKCNSPKLSRHT